MKQAEHTFGFPPAWGGKYPLPPRACRWATTVLLFFGLVLTTRARVDEPSAPALIQDTVPATALNTVGDQVTLTAVFSDAPPAVFQWQKISDGATNDIPGATNTILTLTNLQLADTASYVLKAVNATNQEAISYTSARPLVVNPLPAAVNNLLTIIATQTGLGNHSFTPTWTVATNDNLIAGQAPARSNGNFSEEAPGRNVNSLTADGTLEIASINQASFTTANTNYVTCGNGNAAGSTVTYSLTNSPAGYDLTNITVYGGWVNSGRDQQAYTVYYSTVTSPDLFIPLGSVNFNPADPANAPSATRITLRAATGVLARNVASVKFDFTNPAAENGFCGYAKIVLSGSNSATSPPADSRNKSHFLVATNKSPAFNLLDLLGWWIWDAKASDGQTCQFWRAFDLPADGKVINARLIMTADNQFTLYLDGHKLGSGAEWRELFDYNLLPLQLAPGRHVIAIRAFNFARQAGVILGLRIDLADGRCIEIRSDQSWKMVPNQAGGWEKMTKPPATWPAATIVGPIGTPPWWNEPDFVNMLLAPSPAKVFFWQTTWFQITSLTLCGVLALAIFGLAAQLALHRKERWLLQRERARIAMDVHDDIGSRITQLVLTGEDVQEALPEDSPVRTQLSEIWDDARRVLSSIDEILWALNPRLDTLRDFADYICDYTHKFLEPAGIECVFEVDPQMQLTTADLPLRRSLLMAIKETLNNTVKHSGATELRLKIERHRHNLVVVVQDNGHGFDPAQIPPGRNGLNNLSRRMRELGGSCHLSSQSGKGCRIEFRIPLKRAQKFSWFGK